MESLIKDVGFALRTLRKNLGFTAIAVIMIALGIGACASIFSIVNAVLLQPLPYANPSRLVLIWSELRARNVPDFPFSIPDMKDFRLETKSYDGVAGFFPPGRVTIAGDDAQPEQIRASGVTTNMFSLLGARLQLGRDFKEEDGTPPPAPPNPPVPNAPPPPRVPTIAILSHNFWQRRYGGDPSVIGRMVDFGGGRAEIVGVLQPGFELLFPARTGIEPNVDMWTAARVNFDTAARNIGAFRVIARLKAGVAMDKAQEEAEGVAAEFRALYPLKKNADLHIRIVPMQEDIVREVRPTILVLFGAVLFVLLIACSNVANLLVVHAAARHRELVIRAAIGGSRWRLIRQMLTESAILAAIGGSLGLMLAQAGVKFLIAFAPAKLPRLSAIGIDPVVITFTVLVAILTIVVFGVLPAFRASRPDTVDVLRISGGSPGLRAGRLLRSAVVVTELALSFVLLVGFGLMFRSFMALQRVDPGYDPTHVLTFLLQSPQLNGQNAQNQAAFLEQVSERLGAIPDVESVSAATPLPLDGGVSLVPWATPEAGAADPSAFRQADFHIVRPGYFEALKTKLIAGRTFTKDDNNPNTSVVVIDELLAARAFPTGSPIGKTLLVRNLRANGPNAPVNLTVEVIGVVKHQRQEAVSAEGREAVFFVEQYFGPGAAGRWIVRTKGEPTAIARAVREALVALDPKITLGDVQPMMTLVDKSMGPTRFAMLLIGIFAGIAGLMAAIGLYGVLSTVVRQRTAEIGMRIVFGATRPNILRLIVTEGLRLSSLGVVVGVAAAMALTGWIRSMLVVISPTDATTFGLITVLFLIIAVIASCVPAIRAARLDPTVALREE